MSHTKYLLGIMVAGIMIPTVLFAKTGIVSDQAFGVNIHLRQRHNESDWNDVLTAAADTGATWGREQFNWDVIEPSDDDYNFTSYDRVVTAYQTHDIKMLGLLTYSSSWASANPGAIDYEMYPPNLTAWSDYVKTVTAHYAGSVTYWEIWNEPNYAGFWKGNEADYIDLVDAAITAIHEGNPDAKIVLGGLSGSDYTFLNTVLDGLNDPTAVAAVAVHPYRMSGSNFNYSPEQQASGLNTLPTDLYNIKAVMNRYGLSKTPLWLTEVGWTTGNDGVNKQTQAEYLTRLYTMALAIPDVQKVFWYTLADTSSDESINDAQFGLYEDDWSPKQAVSAYQFVSQQLTGKWLKSQTLPQAQMVDNFSTGLGWEFSGTVCTTGSLNDHLNGYMSVRYTFTADTNCYAPISLHKTLPTDTRVLQFKAKGDNNSTLLRMRVVDSKGETFQYNLGYLPKEWLYYNVQLEQPTSWWNGNHDGKLDQPLRFDSFVLDDTDGLQETGTVQFDDLVSSKYSQVYQYQWHQGKKDIYAYWSAAQEKTVRILLAGVGKVTAHVWKQTDKNYLSGDGNFSLQARHSVTFLQTK
ncbi:MAG: cellulase family glycosylhydrolase [Patescibacteria group bacterium]